ncbi:MAG: hypothetical protein ACK47B_14340 [Armatimonadota bacterium]
MANSNSGGRWPALALAAGLLCGSLCLAPAVPADPAATGSGGEAPLLLAQAFGGRGFGQGFGQGMGQGFGQGLGQGTQFGQGLGQGFGQGFQGGSFGQGGMFSLNPGQTVQLAAYCTDLFSDPPNETTRFTGGDDAQVATAGGRTLTLARALQEGIVAIRGRSDSFDPIRRDGSLALDLYLGNLSGEPVRVAIGRGDTITPQGQAAQPLPAEADRMFALAEQKGLSRKNTLQFAIWAARGSTAEDVEQTQMLQLPKEEVARVQSLLDESQLAKKFDRDRGAYEKRYEQAAAALGEEAREIAGTGLLVTGAKAVVEGLYGEGGEGVVTVRHPRGGEYFYGATLTRKRDGRVSVKLYHLVTGRPIRAMRGGFLLYPKTQTAGLPLGRGA